MPIYMLVSDVVVLVQSTVVMLLSKSGIPLIRILMYFTFYISEFMDKCEAGT